MTRKHTVYPWDIILSQRIIEELPKKEWSRNRRFRCECLNCWKVSDKFHNSLLQSKRWCHCIHTGWYTYVSRKPRFPVEERKMLYRWKAMLDRCYNINNPSYKNYWGRWITVCDEWKDSFETFYSDLWDEIKGKSLDRKDNNGNYCKENCRWADSITQNMNRRWCWIYKCQAQ